ncbi:hypothetical protein GCM10009677_47500 [Sphaerisporangium rubeum]
MSRTHAAVTTEPPKVRGRAFSSRAPTGLADGFGPESPYHHMGGFTPEKHGSPVPWRGAWDLALPP